MRRVEILRLVSMVALVGSMTACQNYTVAPLCTEANSVAIPGTAGFYSTSVQQDDYSVKTTSVVIAPAPETHLNFTTDTGSKDARTCQVGGYNISETFDAEVHAYKQNRIYVTGMGLTELEVFYDRRELTADGIESKLFAMPKSAGQLLGVLASTRLESLAAKVRTLAETSTGLMIDNSKTSPAALIAHSYAAPVGIVYLRK